jgi:hypothetical protein
MVLTGLCTFATLLSFQALFFETFMIAITVDFVLLSYRAQCVGEQGQTIHFPSHWISLCEFCTFKVLEKRIT